MTQNMNSPDKGKSWMRCAGSLVFIVLGGAVAVLVFGVLTAFYFGLSGMRSSEIIRKEVAAGTPELNLLRGLQLQKLNEYGWANKDSGQVKISIDQAMKLLIQEGALVVKVPGADSIKK